MRRVVLGKLEFETIIDLFRMVIGSRPLSATHYMIGMHMKCSLKNNRRPTR